MLYYYAAYSRYMKQQITTYVIFKVTIYTVLYTNCFKVYMIKNW